MYEPVRRSPSCSIQSALQACFSGGPRVRVCEPGVVFALVALAPGNHALPFCGPEVLRPTLPASDTACVRETARRRRPTLRSSPAMTTPVGTSMGWTPRTCPQGCRVRGSLAERFALGGTCVQGICRENALVALAEMPLERLPEFLLGRLESVADRPLHAEEALRKREAVPQARSDTACVRHCLRPTLLASDTAWPARKFARARRARSIPWRCHLTAASLTGHPWHPSRPTQVLSDLVELPSATSPNIYIYTYSYIVAVARLAVLHFTSFYY